MHIVRDQLSVSLEESDWARKAGAVMVPLTVTSMLASIIYGAISGIVVIAVLPPFLLFLPFLLGLSFSKRGRRTIVIDGATRQFRESWGPGTATRVIFANQIHEIRHITGPLSWFHQGLTVHYVEIVLKDGPSIRLDSDQLLGESEVAILADDMSRLLRLPLNTFDGCTP